MAMPEKCLCSEYQCDCHEMLGLVRLDLARILGITEADGVPSPEALIERIERCIKDAGKLVAHYVTALQIPVSHEKTTETYPGCLEGCAECRRKKALDTLPQGIAVKPLPKVTRGEWRDSVEAHHKRTER